MEQTVANLREAVKLQDHPKYGKCFAGSELVAHIMANMHLPEPEAVAYASQLLQLEHIEPAKKSKKSNVALDKFYRFVQRSTVVILGGGFAGATAAKKLEQNKRLNVILIDQKPFFESTPEVLRTFVETTIENSLNLINTITVHHKDYLTRAKFIEGSVVEVTPEKVVTESETIFFDYLVIATGSSYRSNIKQQYVSKSERKMTRSDSARSVALGDTASKIKDAKSVLIVGGGVVGVELAAEIVVKYPQKRVTIVHRHPRLAEKMEQKVSDYVRKFLATRGVNIILNEEVAEPSEPIEKLQGKMYDYQLNPNQAKLSADVSFWCTGTTPNTQFMKKHFEHALGPIGHVNTNEFFQVRGAKEGEVYKNIFAVGDCSGWHEEKMAERAMFHAPIVCEHIELLVTGEPLKTTYAPPTKPALMVVSLGPNNGVVTGSTKMKFTGMIAAKFKSFYFQWMVNRLSSVPKRGPDRSMIAGKINPSKALPKVLIVGASSKIGGKAVTSLWSQFFPVRTSLRPGEVPDPIFERNGIEQIDVDYAKPFTLGLALKGVNTLLFVADPDDPHRFAGVEAYITALQEREHQVKHIIKVFPYSTAISADSHEKSSSALVKQNHHVEHMIKGYCSKHHEVSYTFIRHSPMFDEIANENVASEVASKKTVTIPKGAEYWISGKDIVDAIIAAAIKPKRHANKTYDLLGPDRLRSKKVASILGEVLHETIALTAVSRSDVPKLEEYFEKVQGYPASLALETAEYLHASKVKAGKTEESRAEQAAAEKNRDHALHALFSSSKQMQTLSNWADENAHLFV